MITVSPVVNSLLSMFPSASESNPDWSMPTWVRHHVRSLAQLQSKVRHHQRAFTGGARLRRSLTPPGLSLLRKRIVAGIPAYPQIDLSHSGHDSI